MKPALPAPNWMGSTQTDQVTLYNELKKRRRDGLAGVTVVVPSFEEFGCLILSTDDLLTLIEKRWQSIGYLPPGTSLVRKIKPPPRLKPPAKR